MNPMIWLRALMFIVFVQTFFVAVVPTLIVRSGVGPTLPIGGMRYVGVVPIAIGIAVVLWCNYAFIVRGRGTAAPFDPPKELVVAGIYRYVRNPMYVSANLITFGIALVCRSAAVLGYAVLLAVAYHLFVTLYEEPKLRRVFGDSYARYCAGVPRWIPRAPPALSERAAT
jgi:protein-S-isoprenylcysteine O-methyltransferase Ste14